MEHVPPSSTQAGIRRIAVRGLFGRYDYDIEAHEVPDPDLSRVLILYGSNGSGKSTVLRLLYDMLSGRPNRRHRSSVGEVPFASCSIEFQDGRRVSASRPGATTEPGLYEFQVQASDGTKMDCTWDGDRTLALRGDLGRSFATLNLEADQLKLFRALDHSRSKLAKDEAQFDNTIEFLSEVVPEAIYHLGDNRELQSDRLDDSRREDELDHLPPSERRRRQQRQDSDTRTDALRSSLMRAHRWVSDGALGASNVGGQNTNQIYLDVAKRIAMAASTEEVPSELDPSTLKKRLVELGLRNDGFSALGLLPPAPTLQLADALESVTLANQGALLSVLSPYADALSARLDALEHVRSSLATFLEQSQKFLTDKTIEFSLASGFSVSTGQDTTLPIANLSSGEKHLLLLLTSTIYTRDVPTLFIIDEPELSLNYEWQRSLVDALMACTHGSPTSFVMASHSFELMSSVRDRVAQLKPL